MLAGLRWGCDWCMHAVSFLKLHREPINQSKRVIHGWPDVEFSPSVEALTMLHCSLEKFCNILMCDLGREEQEESRSRINDRSTLHAHSQDWVAYFIYRCVPVNREDTSVLLSP